MENGSQIKVEDHNGDGIEVYVKGVLHDGDIFRDRLSPEQVGTLAKGIRARSRGFFIAAKHELSFWRQCRNAGCSLEEFEENVADPPLGLHQLYSEILRSINFDHFNDHDIAIAMIQWTTFSQRHLTLTELNFALGSDANLRGEGHASDGATQPLKSNDVAILDLIEVFTKELMLVKETVGASGELRSEITFPHVSVSDFFAYGDNFKGFLPRWMQNKDWAEESHARLAEVCSVLLKEGKEMESAGKNPRSLPLHEYAVKFHDIHEQGGHNNSLETSSSK